MIHNDAAGMAIDIPTMIRVASKYGGRVNSVRLIVRWRTDKYIKPHRYHTIQALC